LHVRASLEGLGEVADVAGDIFVAFKGKREHRLELNLN